MGLSVLSVFSRIDALPKIRVSVPFGGQAIFAAMAQGGATNSWRAEPCMVLWLWLGTALQLCRRATFGFARRRRLRTRGAGGHKGFFKRTLNRKQDFFVDGVVVPERS